MALSIPAISMMGTISADQALLDVYRDKVTEAQNVELTADVDVRQVFLDWREAWAEEEPRRPYLKIRGDIKKIRGDFPYDIKEVTLEGDNVFDVDMTYEFLDSEIAKLVAKGLFETDFECPRIFYQVTLKDLPVVCNYKILQPTLETDVPLVFMDVVNNFDIKLNTMNSGYDFSDAFEVSKLHERRLAELMQGLQEKQVVKEDIDKKKDFDFEASQELIDSLANQPVKEEEEDLPDDQKSFVDSYLSMYEDTKKRLDLQAKKRFTVKDIVNGKLDELEDEKEVDEIEDELDDVDEDEIDFEIPTLDVIEDEDEDEFDDVYFNEDYLDFGDDYSDWDDYYMPDYDVVVYEDEDVPVEDIEYTQEDTDIVEDTEEEQTDESVEDEVQEVEEQVEDNEYHKPMKVPQNNFVNQTLADFDFGEDDDEDEKSKDDDYYPGM